MSYPLLLQYTLKCEDENHILTLLGHILRFFLFVYVFLFY